MKFYQVCVKEINGSLTHVRAFYKKEDAQDHLNFFSKDSNEQFVIVEHQE